MPVARLAVFATLATLAALALGACAGAPSPTPQGPRTIEVTMTDDLRYDPAAMTVPVGAPIRFEVHNAGRVQHEFYLGDPAAQEEHAAEMREMGGMAHDEPEGISVAPGETRTLEYTFAEPGEYLAGCHEPGHYEGGMVASITVEP